MCYSFVDTVSNTLQSTAQGTKNAANIASNTTKTYVDSAKGILVNVVRQSLTVCFAN